MPLQDAVELPTGCKVEGRWIAQDTQTWNLEELRGKTVRNGLSDHSYLLRLQPTHLLALSDWPVELRPLSQSKRQALHPRGEAGVRVASASPGLAWPGNSHPGYLSPSLISIVPISVLTSEFGRPLPS